MFRIHNFYYIYCIKFLFIFILLIFLFANAAAEEQIPAARDYFQWERDFLNQYVRDFSRGGYYNWVDSKGKIVNTDKYSLFQANVILWIAGIESQVPLNANIEMIRSGADFIITNMKGLPRGTWLANTDRDGEKGKPFFWSPAVESYISYALLQAYRLAQDKRYLEVAKENLDYYMRQRPDAKVAGGFRFPEHMGFLEMFFIKGEKAYKDYSRKFYLSWRDIHALDEKIQEGKKIRWIHGTATLDLLLYGYYANDEEAYNEGSLRAEQYRLQYHDDSYPSEKEEMERADNGRDYYDKRLAMDLIQWTKTSDEMYKHDAIKTWKDILRFWDGEPPYGFWSSLDKKRKTCFGISQPAILLDLTPPEIISVSHEQTPFYSIRIVASLRDPDYNWMDHNLRGIGLNPDSVFLNYSRDGKNWKVIRMRKIRSEQGDIMFKPDIRTNAEHPVTFVATIPFIVPGSNFYFGIEARDYFNNRTSTKPVVRKISWALGGDSWEYIWFDLVIPLVLLIVLAILVRILFFRCIPIFRRFRK